MPLVKAAPRGNAEAESDTDKPLGSLTTARKLTREETVTPRYAGTERLGPGVRRMVSDVSAWLPGPYAVRVTARSVEVAPAIATKLPVTTPLPSVTLFGVPRIVSLALRLTSKGALTAMFIVTTQLAVSDTLRLSGEHVREET
jgi:hypothetical protein